MASEPAEPTTRQDGLDVASRAAFILAANARARYENGVDLPVEKVSFQTEAQADVGDLRCAGLLADPAQTTELEQLSGGEVDAAADLRAADPTLPVDPSERALAWCRQWMATRETVHKRTAERDERQARIDAARHELTRKDEPMGVCVEAALAALAGDQPTKEESKRPPWFFVSHCCEAGIVAYPEPCPWHPARDVGDDTSEDTP